MSKTNVSGQQLKNGVGSGELGGELSQKIRFLNERFIAKAKEIHGDRYDYSKVAYTTTHNPVEIVCSIHGSFFQTPNSHVSKQSGCRHCHFDKNATLRRYTTTTFIAKAKEIHGDRYDYSKVAYTTSKERVTIICKKHGEFNQHAARHISGHGCMKCKNETVHTWTSSSLPEFINTAKEIHGDRYDYSKAVYIRNDQKVIIRCLIHGEFEQTPNKHLSGTGCPKCSNSGVSRKAINWIKDIASNSGINIQHAMNGGEYRIPGTRYKADGFCANTNTIYEFYGDKWHGNLHVYNETDKCHPFSQLTAGELNHNTMQREQELKALGYRVVSIWEHEYDHNKEQQ